MPSNKSCRDGDRRQGISLQMLKRKFFSSTKSSSWKQPPSVPQLVVLTEFSFLFSVRCSLDMFLICLSYELAADNNYWVMIQVITVFCVSRLENPPSTLFSSSIEFSTMELILLYSSASIAVSQCTVVQCTQCNRVYTVYTVYTTLTDYRQDLRLREHGGLPGATLGEWNIFAPNLGNIFLFIVKMQNFNERNVSLL